MTHPITVPLELVEKWGHDANLSGVPYNDEHWTYEQDIATRAAQWGADQQLAEDAEWLDHNALNEPHLKIIPMGESLKEAMRPKPPSLKEQALLQLDTLNADLAMHGRGCDLSQIRRALEALPE